MCCSFILTSILLCLLVSAVSSKVYERCELARELVEIYDFPRYQVATWVCITYRESTYNTSAINQASGDYGLFQISDRWWCSPPGKGQDCNITCAALVDDDIEDDVVCAKHIYRRHKRITGDGFTAWVVYPYYCKDKENVKEYVKGCFDDENELVQESKSTEITSTSKYLKSTEKASDVVPEDKSSSVTSEAADNVIEMSPSTGKYDPFLTTPLKYKDKGDHFSVSISPILFPSSGKFMSQLTELQKQISEEKSGRQKTTDLKPKSLNTISSTEPENERHYSISGRDYKFTVIPDGFKLTKTDS